MLAVLTALLLLSLLPRGSQPGSDVHLSRGIVATVPSGWSATSQPLTFVTYPPQVLAVASFRFPVGRSGANGCRPDAVFARMPADGVFVYGWEYARPSPVGPVDARDFPRRPARFRLTNHATYECMGESFMIRFRQARRFFQIHVIFGARVAEATRARTLGLLDSLRISPR